jgi:hypothetical protein
MQSNGRFSVTAFPAGVVSERPHNHFRALSLHSVSTKMPRYSEYDATLEQTLGISARGVGSNQVNRRIEKALLGVLDATADDGWDIVFKAAALNEGDLDGMLDEDVAADLAAHEGKTRLTRAAEAKEWEALREQIESSRNRVLRLQSEAAAAAAELAVPATPPGFTDAKKVAALHSRPPNKKKYADAVALPQIDQRTPSPRAARGSSHMTSHRRSSAEPPSLPPILLPISSSETTEERPPLT